MSCPQEKIEALTKELQQVVSEHEMCGSCKAVAVQSLLPKIYADVAERQSIDHFQHNIGTFMLRLFFELKTEMKNNGWRD